MKHPLPWVIGGIAVVYVVMQVTQGLIIVVGGTALGLYMYKTVGQTPKTGEPGEPADPKNYDMSQYITTMGMNGIKETLNQVSQGLGFREPFAQPKKPPNRAKRWVSAVTPAWMWNPSND
jgi:hypothetical protein